MIIPSRRDALPGLVAATAAVCGALVALHYARLGLTLSHYDARGHLVVARRIIDSITPGWQQIGAVWLPLPHLLNALPVQVDAFYRTGASAVVLSVLAFAIATGAIASIVLDLTGASAPAIGAAAVFAFNPNVLYLQATPMTEPLLLALTAAAVALLLRSVNAPYAVPTPLVGWAFALACLTRYEAWPVTACAVLAAVWTRWRRGEACVRACRATASIAVYPCLAVVGFVIFSRVVVGQWFVGGDFFIPENKALGKPLVAAAEILWGTHMLSGYLVIAAGTAGLIALGASGLFSRPHGDRLIVLSLCATAALPWAAFVQGHPFRIRYMVPLIAIEAVGAGVAVGLIRKARGVALLALLAITAWELHPLDSRAPMVVEAQWDRPNAAPRRQVTDCLRAASDGEKIMASMGSLGHYMQEASRDGFAIRDFLHEGNGDIWLAALADPRPFAGWVLIEEKAQGGDMLAKLGRLNPHFLDGYSRVCEGAGLALYRRTRGAVASVSDTNGSRDSTP